MEEGEGIWGKEKEIWQRKQGEKAQTNQAFQVCLLDQDYFS